MERRNEYWDYWLAAQLTPLRFLIAGKSLMDELSKTFPAYRALKQVTDANYAGFELCIEQVNNLKTVVEGLIPKEKEGLEAQLQAWERAAVQETLNAFETAISIQFSQVNTYRVTPKGTHDVRKLIESSADTFGLYWHGMPELARTDWQAGARCLAFELPTACGFHVVRAMEAVVVDYLKRSDKVPQRRDLFHYVELMRELQTDEQAVDLVEQIRKHHRNPLMHPEDILDVPMAMSLFDLCRAAIISVVSEMEKGGLVSLEPQSLLNMPLGFTPAIEPVR